MPTWLAHLLMLICGLMVEWPWLAVMVLGGHTDAFLCHSPSCVTGWSTRGLSRAPWHTGLLHGGSLAGPLLLLQVPDATGHVTLQPLCLGLPRQKRHLHLHHAPSLKQVIGLEQVHGVQAISLLKFKSFSSWCQFCLEWLIWCLFTRVQRISSSFRNF